VGPRYLSRPVVRNRGQPLSARHVGRVSQRPQADFFARQSSPPDLCPNAESTDQALAPNRASTFAVVSQGAGPFTCGFVWALEDLNL
jgi:hypothetical protein